MSPFNSFQEFLAMGGHGPYVWWSYGAFVVLLLALAFVYRQQRKKIQAQIKRVIRRETLEKEEVAGNAP